MTPPVFLAPLDVLDELGAGPGRLVLDGAEGRHAATVRRLQAGERVDITDGEGRRASCVVAGVGRDVLELDVERLVSEAEPQPRLVVVQALAKGDRGEQAVELLTEVGADVIVPWAAARSVVQWRGDRGARALERWRATAREAGKQSRRTRFPVVTGVAGTVQVADRLAAAVLPIVLHEGAERPLAGRPVPAEGEVVLVVGPEGGIAEEELDAFASAGAGTYRLGPTVLRTSTAGAAAAAVLLAASGRWGA